MDTFLSPLFDDSRFIGPGELVFSLGLSNIHGNNDQSMLEAAMPLYDALYAWCRSVQAEAHSWQPESMPGAAS